MNKRLQASDRLGLLASTMKNRESEVAALLTYVVSGHCRLKT